MKATNKKSQKNKQKKNKKKKKLYPLLLLASFNTLANT